MKNTLFLDALHCKNTQRPPVWLMRQAGRFLPEYQEIKKGHALLDLFLDSDRIVEITKLPIDILDVDAAILFSDILMVCIAMGFSLNFVEKVGPVIDPVISSYANVESIGKSDFSKLAPIFDGIQKLKQVLDRPLIGFCGGPFTVASYMFARKRGEGIKHMDQWLCDKKTLHLLLQKLTASTKEYLSYQIEAKVDAIQIFDSWAGMLSYEDFNEFCIPYLKELINFVKSKDVPVIIFMRGSCRYVNELTALNPNAISFDAEKSLTEMEKCLPTEMAIQGNLDPDILQDSLEQTLAHVEQIKAEMKNHPGFIFNLGHGVLPKTPVSHVRKLIELLRSS